MTRAPQPAPILEWGAAGVALEGEESGDLHVVVELPAHALVAVIDGLGHGPEAAVAAGTAASILRAHAAEPVDRLIELCHEELRKTRGAVISLAAFDALAGSMTWLGVGNVDGALLRVESSPGRPSEAIAVRGGVVGYRLPPLRAATLPVSCGDVLILATDGLRSGFCDRVLLERDPQELAQVILDEYAKGSDDALVVVARYVGSPP